MKKIARELLVMAKELVSDDRNKMGELIKEVLDRKISLMKFKVKVTFGHEWSGYQKQTYWQPGFEDEFKAWGENMVIMDRVRRISIEEVRDEVLAGLERVHGLRVEPEELVESSDFMRVLRQVLDKEYWAVRDTEVDLEDNKSTEIDLELDLRIVGNVIMAEASDDTDDVMKAVNDNAYEWYPPDDDYYEYDRDDVREDR